MGLALSSSGPALAQWSGGTGTADIYEADSQVGIGTSTPAAALHVKQTVNDPNNIQTARFVPYTAGQRMSLIHFGINADWYIRSGATTGNVILQDGGGKVGVGITAPSRPLDVNGGVHSSGSQAELSFADRNSAWVETPTNGERWLWYASGNTAKLWSGDVKLAVTPSGRLGIGTITPTYKVHVASGSNGLRVEGPTSSGSMASFGANGDFAIDATGSTGGRFLVQHDGKVGVGTNAPLAKFHLYRSDNDPTQITARFSSVGLVDPNDPNSPKNISLVHYGASGDWYIRSVSRSGKVILQDTGGKVGIGTQDPTSELTVKGTITAGDVTVDSTWADHVFAEGYALMPLEDVGKFIAVNRRLPGVPSAAEVKAKGVSVSQTQAKLLEKIEELTLYSLELKNQNEALQAKLDQQTAQFEARLARLEKK